MGESGGRGGTDDGEFFFDFQGSRKGRREEEGKGFTRRARDRSNFFLPPAPPSLLVLPLPPPYTEAEFADVSGKKRNAGGKGDLMFPQGSQKRADDEWRRETEGRPLNLI